MDHYEKFLADILRRVDYEFSFRNHEYYIDYWEWDPCGTWVPGWIFTNDFGRTLVVNENGFLEFVGKVNHWMMEHEGVSLEDMFNTCCKSDNTGDFQIISTQGTGHQYSGDEKSPER